MSLVAASPVTLICLRVYLWAGVAFLHHLLPTQQSRIRVFEA